MFWKMEAEEIAYQDVKLEKNPKRRSVNGAREQERERWKRKGFASVLDQGLWFQSIQNKCSQMSNFLQSST